jgi:hypothetical protein
VIFADVDPARSAEGRGRVPALSHDRPFAPPPSPTEGTS